jgi:monomeric isocitrate dehydrogenase
MTKRLQVLLEDEELADIKRVAQRQRTSVAEWVRSALRRAREADAGQPASAKLHAIREGARHDFPTGSIDDMLEEIERGYGRPP